MCGRIVLVDCSYRYFNWLFEVIFILGMWIKTSFVVGVISDKLQLQYKFLRSDLDFRLHVVDNFTIFYKILLILPQKTVVVDAIFSNLFYHKRR